VNIWPYGRILDISNLKLKYDMSLSRILRSGTSAGGRSKRGGRSARFDLWCLDRGDGRGERVEGDTDGLLELDWVVREADSRGAITAVRRGRPAKSA
jgi:hypothetical protein